MGGHEHGHGHHEIKVPDWRIYKVKDVPLLQQTQNALHAQGLHDPWLRNEVWRYNEKCFGTESYRTRMILFRGFKWGLLAAVLTVGAGKLYDSMNPSEHDDSHGHH